MLTHDDTRKKNFLVIALQHEVDRNQELLAQIKKLEERESEMERNLTEKGEANRALRKNLEALNKKLEDHDGRLSSSNQVNAHSGICPSASRLPSYSALCFLFPDCQHFEGWGQRTEAENSESGLYNLCSDSGKPGTAGAVRFTAPVQTRPTAAAATAFMLLDLDWPH